MKRKNYQTYQTGELSSSPNLEIEYSKNCEINMYTMFYKMEKEDMIQKIKSIKTVMGLKSFHVSLWKVNRQYLR